jgi:two-component system, chemotaxis family, sensor kinase Cph1
VQRQCHAAGAAHHTHARTLLGLTLDEVIGSDAGQMLRAQLHRLAEGPAEPLLLARLPAQAPSPCCAYDVLAHRIDGLLLLEFEAVDPAAPAPDARLLQADLNVIVATLEGAASVQQLLDAAVTRMRALTGFDRVMAYRFAADGSGAVVAEARADGLSPLLGLHYPALDIPLPARRLFTLLWLRHLPDVDYEPVPIEPANPPGQAQPNDLTYATLRSVSLMYRRYLHNMGVRASVVTTLLKDGELWGLISCHHHGGPRHLPHDLRGACALLSRTLSLLIGAKADLEVADYRAELAQAREALTRSLAPTRPLALTLCHGTPNLLDAIAADGCAVSFRGELHTAGEAPHPALLAPLFDWLAAQHGGHDLIATDALGERYAPLAGHAALAAGLLAVRISQSRPDFIAWFRGEQVREVAWAGDPAHPAEIEHAADGSVILSPRRSFALWREQVRGRSRPWLDCEREHASALRSAVVDVVLAQADEIDRINRELARSNIELESFAYAASHDLKEPLRGIHNYAELLAQAVESRLTDEELARLRAIARLSQRMDDLIDSLLQYARVGRADLALADTDLNAVLDRALDALADRIVASHVQVDTQPLPTLRCDPQLVEKVLQNLVSNAIKYSDRPQPRVEIGSVVLDDGTPAIFVRDDGIGIDPRHHEHVFQIFRRLHGRDEYGGGAGAGLTIARRSVERHGGRLWLESTPGAGSTFYFTLGRRGTADRKSAAPTVERGHGTGQHMPTDTDLRDSGLRLGNPPPPARVERAGHRARVLIIDDSPEDREVCRLFLGQDYEVTEAASARGGLQRWLADPPDCVLLDQRLPDGDGLDLIEAARAQLGDALPVVLMTGLADTHLAVHALKAGVSELLIKQPLAASELRQAVRNTVQRTALERELREQRRALAAKNAELERTLAALRASEARFKLGVQVGGLALAQIDYLRDEIVLSAEAAALYGFDASAADRPLRRALVHSRVHGDDSAMLQAEIARAMDPAGDGRFTLEHRIVLPSGAVRWLQVRKQVSFDADHARPLTAMLAATDITARRESEARLGLAHQAAGLGEWTWDIAADAYDGSPGMFEIHGLPPASRLDRRALARVVVPEDMKRLRRQMLRALPQGHVTADYRVMHPQRGLRWMMGIGRVVDRDARGRPRRMTGIAVDITDRKVIEQRLAASEARFAALAQAAPLVLYTTDAQGVCDYVNERFWQLTGLTPGLPLRHAHLHPDDLPLLRAAWRDSRASGRMHEHRFRLRVAAGPDAPIEWRWYRTRALPVRDAQGTIERWVGIAYDVHDELLRETRLQWLVAVGDSLVGARDEQAVTLAMAVQLREQFQVAHCGLTRIDPAHVTAAVPIAGTAGLALLTHPPLLAQFAAGEMVVLDNTGTASMTAGAPGVASLRSMVAVPLQRDGADLYVLWLAHTHPHAWTQAELLLIEAAAQRAWLALENAQLFDATRSALRARDAALEESRHNERFLRQIADTVPEALYLFDLRERRNVYCNRKVFELIGYSPEELGDSAGTVLPESMHPDDRPRLAEHLAALQKAPDGTVRSIEYRMRRRDGAWRWFSSSETVWSRSSDGAVQVILGAAQDVTERRAAVDALHDASRRKDEFLAMLAHELRNPLAPIRNAVEILRRGADARHGALRRRPSPPGAAPGAAGRRPARCQPHHHRQDHAAPAAVEVHDGAGALESVATAAHVQAARARARLRRPHRSGCRPTRPGWPR